MEDWQPSLDIVRMRDVRPSDEQTLLQWRNRPEVSKYMYTSRLITQEEHAQWFPVAIADVNRRYWIIRFDETDVGLVSLYNIDTDNRRAHWAFYLCCENYQGKGIGAFVELWVLDHVFNCLAVNKLCCEVLAFNTSVINMHKRFGFHEEGRFRRHIHRGEDYCDVCCFGILREEWQRMRPEVLPKLQRIANHLRR